MQFNIVSLPLILGIGFLVFLMRLVAHRARGRLVSIFMIFGALIIAQCLFYVLTLTSINSTIQIFFFHLMVFSTIFIPVVTLLFLLEYLGYDSWINTKSIVFLGLIPVIAGLLELTDPLHGLFWEGVSVIWVNGFSYVKETPGFIPIILSIYLYFILGISIALFTWGVLNAPSYRRKELNIIVAALAIPLLFDLLRILELQPLPHLYITPFGVMLSVVLLGISIIKYDFMNVVPAAYDRLFTDVQDAIMVMDHKQNIIDYNRAAGALFFEDQRHRQKLSVRDLPRGMQEAVRDDFDEIEVSTREGQRFFDVKFTEILGRDGFLRSTVIALHDISWRKKTELQLQELIASKESLLAGKERLIREINHRVKNNFNLASSLLFLESQQFSDASVKDAFDASRDRLRTMSLLNERLHHSDGSHDLDLGAYLCSVAKDLLVMHSPPIEGLDVKCHMDQVMVSPREAIPCGLIVNELISNALKHAFVAVDQDSPQIDVKLVHASEGLVQLNIADNGCGLPDDYRQSEGQSLGMRLVYMLGEDQLGGKIKISNQQGASFFLTFLPEGHAPVRGE